MTKKDQITNVLISMMTQKRSCLQIATLFTQLQIQRKRKKPTNQVDLSINTKEV